MCSPVPCNHCGKTTWAGCGDHVDQVKQHVPDDQWCTCSRAPQSHQADAASQLHTIKR